ncbi:MAG: hypothetical protein KC422_26100 [Trueperaceae bacterium]|nr:hypothetical protein [Trueperaceae bacterium]
MQQDELLGSFLLRVVVRKHRPCYALQNLKTGEVKQFETSADAFAYVERSSEQLSGQKPNEK